MVILEDGTPENNEWRRFSWFKIVDDTDDEVDMDQDEQFDIEKTEKQEGDVPAKGIKWVYRRI